MPRLLKDVYQPEQGMETDDPVVLDNEAIRAECDGAAHDLYIEFHGDSYYMG